MRAGIAARNVEHSFDPGQAKWSYPRNWRNAKRFAAACLTNQVRLSLNCESNLKALIRYIAEQVEACNRCGFVLIC